GERSTQPAAPRARNSKPAVTRRRLLYLALGIVLFGLLGAVAGLSVFKGWLHHRAGFNGESKRVEEGSVNTPATQPVPPTAKPRPVVSAADTCRYIVADLQRRDPE